MRAIPIFSLMLVALTLTGCQSRSIVGTWESTGAFPIRVTFESNGKFSMTPPSGNADVKLTADYELIENRLKITDLKVDLPEDNMFSGFANQMTTDQELTMNWKTDDEIVLEGEGILRGGFKRVEE